MALSGKMRTAAAVVAMYFAARMRAPPDNCWAICFKNEGITSCCSILWQAWERRQAAMAVAAGYL